MSNDQSEETSSDFSYHYVPLNYQKPQFRILTLLPSADHEDRIRGTLRVENLEQPPPYAALSYAWGDDFEAQSLHLQTGSLPIRKNLFDALSALRHASKPCDLWIDAVCINARDVDERHSQVRCMRTIYDSATEVIVWLGEGDQHTKRAMKLLDEIATGRHNFLKGVPNFSRLDLDSLLGRPWFKRMWVVQEVVGTLGECTIRCGSDKMEFWTFCLATRFAKEDKDYATNWNLLGNLRYQLQQSRHGDTVGGRMDPATPQGLLHPWKDMLDSFALSKEALQSWYTTSKHKPLRNDANSERGGSNYAGTTLMDFQATRSPDGHVPEYENASMHSDLEDVAVSAPRGSTMTEVRAVRLFGAFLAELDILRVQHEHLLTGSNTSRFVVIYRKVLKVYVRRLREEAVTDLQHDTVKILGRYRNRRSIALQVASYIRPERTDDKERFSALAEQALQKQMWEDWNDGTLESPEPAPEATDVLDEDSEDEMDEHDEELQYKHLDSLAPTNIAKVFSFLHKTAPLQLLTAELWLQTLSPSLRDLLDTTPQHALELIDEGRNPSKSMTNSWKAWIEDRSRKQWDWWPLLPRIPPLPVGSAMLKWEVSIDSKLCSSSDLEKLCGRPQYTVLSSLEAVAIKHLVSIMSEHPPRCCCCSAPPARINRATAFEYFCQYCRYFSPLHFAKPSTGPSISIELNNQPTQGVATSINSQARPPQVHLRGTASTKNTQQARVGDETNNATQDNNLTTNTLRVVFGIKDLQGYHDIEEMETHAQLTDATFFQDLKKNHRKHRSLIQRWFSPYVFRYCRFVQVRTVGPTLLDKD